jgi:hypothetical protein
MNSAHVSHVDSPAAGVASWYTPGRSDGFGDRLLMSDNTDAISLELLRFRRDVASIPGFEHGLRDRVDHLLRFRHPSFPLIRAVVHLDEADLTLVSAHIAGQRLSELATGKLRKGLHPAVVTWIVREITPALAALQSSGTAVSHGALNADRIVLTSEGRLCIVEHAMGSAIRRLNVTPAVFWRQFGLLAPSDVRGQIKVDQRTDVVQLGTIALSLLLARPVGLHDFQRRLPALLDEFTALAAVSPSVFAAPLRAWLERALQLAPRSYRSAEDAVEGLAELPVSAGPAAALKSTVTQTANEDADATDAVPDHVRRLVSISRFAAERPLRPPVSRGVAEDTPEAAAPPQQFTSEITTPAATPSPRRWNRAYAMWLATALGAVAVVQGIIIANLGTQPPTVTVAAPALPAPQQPAPSPTVATPGLPAGASSVEAARTPSRADDAVASSNAQAAARQRSRRVRFSSPIELNVFDGDRVLGSTADGPIVTAAGTRQLEFVNAALGYRARQTVTVQAGVITSLALPVPMGRININAQPWAQVLIDESPIGETPLANVPVPLGQHQITFRHPQLGERREVVTVRADSVARVTITFDR